MYQIQHVAKIVVGHPNNVPGCSQWVKSTGNLGKEIPNPHVGNDSKYVSHQRRGLENKTAPELYMSAVLFLVLLVFQRWRL